MYSIQANESGTRSISVSDENLSTIRRFSLLQLLIDSSGIVTEQSLDKLKLNIRIDVVYHRDMKAFGLRNLIALYEDWNRTNPETTPAE